MSFISVFVSTADVFLLARINTGNDIEVKEIFCFLSEDQENLEPVLNHLVVQWYQLISLTQYQEWTRFWNANWVISDTVLFPLPGIPFCSCLSGKLLYSLQAWWKGYILAAFPFHTLLER